MSISEQNSLFVDSRVKLTKRTLAAGNLTPTEEQALTAQLAVFEQFLIDHPPIPATAPIQPA